MKTVGSQVTPNVRKSLHPLQHAAGKTEALVGPGRNILSSEKENLKSMRNDKEKIIDTVEKEIVRSKGKKKKCGIEQGVQTEKVKPVITAEDLTSEDGPSENYWELLAERRRVALQETLEENQALHEENKILEEENETLKTTLAEAKSLIETLTELLSEKDNLNEETVNEEDTNDEEHLSKTE